MKHIMLDLETASTNSHAAILSIGAVFFDIETGEIGSHYYQTIDPASSLDCCDVDAPTIQWWMKQSDEARSIWNDKDSIELDVMLETFKQWISENKTGSVNIWGNGCGFDNIILSNIYDRFGIKKPWAFWADLDVRTLSFLGKSLLREDVKKQSKENHKGTLHNALDDCLLQIGYCTKIYQQLRDLNT